MTNFPAKELDKSRFMAHICGMTPESLKAWRKSRNWSQARASSELGISENSYMAYERGWSRRKGAQKTVTIITKIPKTVALACAAIAYQIPPKE